MSLASAAVLNKTNASGRKARIRAKADIFIEASPTYGAVLYAIVGLGEFSTTWIGTWRGNIG